MKKIMLIAALAALAACSKQDAAPVADATDQAAATPAAPSGPSLAADGKTPAGNFQITTSEGKLITEEVKADGTYTETVDGKVTETGRWEQKAPDTYCYTKDGADAKQVCNTEKVDEKGVWTSVDPEGKTVTVVRVES